MKTILLSALLFLSTAFYVVAQGVWAQKASFTGSGRQLATGFSIGCKIYIGGGGAGGPAYLKDFWEWDPSSNSWTRLADLPYVMVGATGFSIGNKGYIGFAGFGFLPRGDFYEYDPLTNKWTAIAKFPGLPRQNAVSFTIGNFGYVGTGYAWDSVNNTLNTVKDVWQYNPVTNSWTRKADFPGAGREYATGFSIGSKGYVGLGVQPDSWYDFYEYDPSNNTWTRKADYAGGTVGQAVGFSIGTKGYIGTGILFTPTGGANTNQFWEYNPATDTWTRKADVGGLTKNVAVGISNGSRGYITVGLNWVAGNQLDLWEYNPVPGAADPCVTPQNAGDCETVLSTIRIAQNPVYKVLQLKSAYVLKFAQVYNAIGQKVTEGNLVNNSLRLPVLATGMYAVRVYCDKNEASKCFQFMKEN